MHPTRPRPRSWLLRVPGLLVLGLLSLPQPARALSEDPSRVVYGNAAPLRRGEMRIGVFSPFQYGAQERVTLMSHPILDLLLTPNVFIRLTLVHERWGALSVDAGYAQSFLRSSEGGYPGFLTFSGIGSAYLGGVVTVSARAAYLYAFAPASDTFVPSAYLTILLPWAYRLHLSGIFPYGLSGQGFENLSGKLVVGHRFRTFLVVLGVSVGRVWLVDAPILNVPVQTPVYPVIDVIWEF